MVTARVYVLPAIGRIADISNAGSNDTVDEHRQHASVIFGAAEAAGRDPATIELTHNADCVIAPTQREYDQLVADLAERAGMTVTEYQNGRLRNTLAGTPEQVCDRIQEYVGLRHSLLLRRFPGSGPRRKPWPFLPRKSWSGLGL